MCHISQSPQQYIYSLYMEIALAELKAYVMIEYALLIQRVSGQNNLIETNKVRLNYKNIIENALDSVIKAMQKADRVVWRCDPEEHKHNVTYDEVTRLLQGYIENEVDLNSEGSCAQTCSDYQNTTTKGCFDQQFCSQQPKCAGRIHNCQFIDSYLSVCQSPECNNRRYEYIQNNDRKRFGDSEECWREVNRVESWSRWLFWQCSYCFCLCDEPSLKSDRYFNLRETISDVKANKVVTGVRFVKKNRIFHLQIQQGELLPQGAVNKSTVEWKPVDDYKISDSNITEGVDYHEMSYEKRAIDLDEILNTHQRTSLVTGLSFHVVSGRLNLMVMFSYFDFAKGQLLEPKVISTWQTHEDVEDRRKLNIDNLDVPTRSVWGSQPMSRDNQYLEFVNSGIEADASQSTIPFIDIQDVVINPPAPISGIGIYYKSSKNYGGFVAPKIISYDLSQHLRNL
ncbi:hypothetical protein KR215_009918 [Drosophila sulfurigaster]|nr:hypothetical protein KR215_009918 [Drosophila sulfurigaster]